MSMFRHAVLRRTPLYEAPPPAQSCSLASEPWSEDGITYSDCWADGTGWVETEAPLCLLDSEPWSDSLCWSDGHGWIDTSDPPPPDPGFPAWDPPTGLLLVDGGGGNGPAENPVNGSMLVNKKYTNWAAGGFWPSVGLPAIANGDNDTDPTHGWTMTNCHIDGVTNGHAIRHRWGVTFQDVWFENTDNICMMANNQTTITVRNVHARNTGQVEPADLIWNDTGVIKITAGESPPTGVSTWIDVDGLYVDTAINSLGVWTDYFVNVRKIWNMKVINGCRRRGLMIEVSAGQTGWAPHLKDIEIGDCPLEYFPFTYSPFDPNPDSVFNGSVLFMNSSQIVGENITVVTTPSDVSAFAFQDAADRHEGPNGDGVVDTLDGPTVLKDIDLNGGLVVLTGSKSTTSRAYVQPPGDHGAGTNIRIRNFEVWVEAATQSEALTRAQTVYTESPTVIAKTKQEIIDDLTALDLQHLLPTAYEHATWGDGSYWEDDATGWAE